MFNKDKHTWSDFSWSYNFTGPFTIRRMVLGGKLYTEQYRNLLLTGILELSLIIVFIHCCSQNKINKLNCWGGNYVAQIPPHSSPTCGPMTDSKISCALLYNRETTPIFLYFMLVLREFTVYTLLYSHNIKNVQCIHIFYYTVEQQGSSGTPRTTDSKFVTNTQMMSTLILCSTERNCWDFIIC